MMDSAYFEKLSQYFKASGSELDKTLRDLLDTLTLEIEKASDLNALKVLTHTILITAVHLSRKRAANDLQSIGFPALLSAFENNLSLCRTLEVVREEIKNEIKLHIPWTSNLPTRLIGFDPRYEQAVGEQNWKGWLAEVTKIGHYNPGSLAKIEETYQQAKRKIYLDFHDPSTRYDLLLVDFSWLPELAYQGHILPVDVFVPQIEDLIKEKIHRRINEPKESKIVEKWEYVLRHLASAGNDRYYAFPILLNFHSFLRRKDDLTRKRGNLYLELDHCLSAIQDARTACCVYELYAYFAYHGACPIQCQGSGMEFKIKLDLPIDGAVIAEHKVFKAILDYLTRLKMVHSQKEASCKPFRTDHLAQVHLLNSGSQHGGFDACVSFPLELNGRLSHDVYECRKPFSHPIHIDGNSDSHFLTSLGGYGLAISRQSNDSDRAAQIACRLFEDDKSLKMEDYGKLLRLENVLDIKRFVKYHCRPRIPFWSHIEEILSDALVNLSEIVGSNITRAKFVIVKDEVREKLLAKNAGLTTMQLLNERLRWAFLNNGWEVNGSDV